MEDKRPNRHSSPSNYAKRIKRGHKHGRFIFCRKKNREVRELLKAMA